MFRAFLIGAGLAAIFDAATAFRIAEINSLRLEYLQWSMFGTLSIACLIVIGMSVAFRLKPFASWGPRISDGQAFWAGLIMGLMPVVTVFFPILEVARIPMGGMNRYACLAIWLTPVAILLRLAPTAPAFARPGHKLQTPLTFLAPLILLVGFVIGMVQGQELPPRPQLPEAQPLSADLAGKPDLVLVSLDTLRADLQRGDVDLMPLLTELKMEGMWPKRCVSTSNQTVPGHIGLLAGLNQDQHLVNRNSEMTRMPEDVMLAHLLRKVGYRTAGVISNAMVSYFEDGFEAFDETRADYGDRYYFLRLVSGSTWFAKFYGIRRATVIVEDWINIAGEDTLPPGMSAYTTESAMSYLDELTVTDHPFFLFAHYMDPHSPYTAPKETADRFADPVNLPQAYSKMANDHRSMINRIRDDLMVEEKRADAKQAALHLRDLYDEELLYMDSQVRKLVDAIRAKGRPTLLIITSDHGEYFGEHNLIEHSRGLFVEVIDVPFVAVGLNGFDVPKGQIPELFSVIDVVPTMAAAAGIEISGVEGPPRTGVDLLSKDAAAELDGRIHFLGWNSTKRGLMGAAENGEWKVIGRFNAPVEPNGPPIMDMFLAYQSTTDPGEVKNVLEEAHPDLDPLWERLIEGGMAWQKLGFFDPDLQEGLTDTTKAVMEQLGYTDED